MNIYIQVVELREHIIERRQRVFDTGADPRGWFGGGGLKSPPPRKKRYPYLGDSI